MWALLTVGQRHAIGQNLIVLHKGNGEQILEESWVKYAHPTATSEGLMQFWLNAGGKFPDAPRDMFYCSGFQGQMVAIIPSLIWLSYAWEKKIPIFDFNDFERR
jgi:hypothetical protein